MSLPLHWQRSHLAVAYVMAMLLASAAQPMAAAETAPAVEISKFGVSTSVGPPVVSGNAIAWVDLGARDLHVYHLDRQMEEIITTAQPSGPGVTSISGNIVVWEDIRNGNPDVFAFNLETSEEIPVVINPARQYNPHVDGTLVVWLDDRSGSWGVFGYDLAAKTEFPIVSGGLDVLEASLRLSGTRIGWTATSGPNTSSVEILDLSTGVTRTIGERAALGDMTGDLLLLLRPSPNSVYHNDLYGYDLRTDTEFLISPRATVRSDNHISEPFIVYQDSSISGPGSDSLFVYSFDIDRRTAFPISLDHPSPSILAPAISGNLVVWANAMGIHGAYLRYPSDWPLPDGHFYTQANGRGGITGTGFAVTDEPRLPFYSTFSSLSLESIGYPISARFTFKGLPTQLFQKLALQGRPDGGVAFLNLFDELHEAGKDGWLEAARFIPPPEDTTADTGLSWDEVVARHLAILDRDPALRDAYLSEPRWLALYGLPTGYGDYPEVSVVRGQRAALQRWKVDLPWARAGEVTVANGGEIAREAGLFPEEPFVPRPPPGQ